MTKVSFYHLTTAPLEQALPVLLEKSLSAGHRVVLMAGSAERVAHLDAHLWTFDPPSFLPHGSGQDGMEMHQPIFLTDEDKNPNGADLLVLTDGVTSRHLESFTRCLTLFDGQDDAAVALARSRWKEWNAAGHELIYYQQTDRGGWTEKARNKQQGEQDAQG
jgi:DNA polymerase-3 subunit chi